MTPRKRHAYAAPGWAAEQRVGDVGTKAVLLLLANYADEAFSCYPGQEKIADETEQSTRTVRRQIERLEEMGLIKREKRYGPDGKRTSDRYFLQLDVTVNVKRGGGAWQSTTGQGDRQSLPDESSGSPAPAAQNATTGHGDRQSTTGHPDATTGQTGPVLPDTGVRVTPSGTPSGTPSAADAADAPVDDGRARRAKRGTPVPENFEVTVGMRAWAAQRVPRADVDAETERFLAYHRFRGTIGKDWIMGWRNWMLNTVRYPSPGQPVNGRQAMIDRVVASIADAPGIPEVTR